MNEEEQERIPPQACRDHVRETFFFKVRFQRLCREEFERTMAEWHSRRSFERASLPLLDVETEVSHGASSVDAQLLTLLLEMDEKIDQIIAQLTKETTSEDLLEQATGINLSGGGMRMRVEKPMETGQFLCATLLLSRIPFVRVMVLGQVIYVKPRDFSSKLSPYDVGVQFLEMDAEDRERIIAFVFQKHREVLRKLREKDGAYEEVSKDRQCADRIACPQDSHS